MKLLSIRQLAVYASGLLIVSLADPRPTTFLLGCIFAAVAWALRVWAFGHLEKNQVMVTTGPYAHCRNPAYLGSFLALIGVTLAAGNPDSTRGWLLWGFGLGLSVGFFLIYLPRKFRKEYTRLISRFGDQAKEHAANVPDFWPRISPWRSGDDRSFSWGRVTHNYEWSWGVVLTLLFAAIWFIDRWSPFHA